MVILATCIHSTGRSASRLIFLLGSPIASPEWNLILPFPVSGQAGAPRCPQEKAGMREWMKTSSRLIGLLAKTSPLLPQLALCLEKC